MHAASGNKYMCIARLLVLRVDTSEIRTMVICGEQTVVLEYRQSH